MMKKGFSLAEVLISIGVLSVGMLGVMSALTYGTRAVHVGARQTEAVDWARKLVDLIRIRNLAFNNFPNAPTSASGVNDASGNRDLDDPPFDTGDDMPADSGFKRQIKVERLNPAATANDWDYELMKITVTLFYFEKAQVGNDGSRAGVSSPNQWRTVSVQSIQSRP